MKKNLLYLAGFIFAAAGLFSSCNEDDLNYSEIATETQTLVINLDDTAEGRIRILEGNGNYKVSSSNEEIATAVVSGDEVIVTGLQFGTASLTVTDWAKKSTQVQVTVDKMMDLVLTNTSVTIMLEKMKSINVYTGNGGYSVTVADPSIVKATVNEAGKIDITALKVGNTTVTVKDKRGKTANIEVKSIKELKLDYESEIISILPYGKEFTINILDGNGNYSLSFEDPYAYLSIISKISDDGLSVTLIGGSRKVYNKSFTISDGLGASRTIKVGLIDYNILEWEGYCYYAKGSMSTGKVGIVTHSPEFGMSLLQCKSGTTATASGYAIQFKGDLSVGNKKEAKLYKIAKGVVDQSTESLVTDCKVEQRATDNGWYSVSFQEVGIAFRSYIITKKTE